MIDKILPLLSTFIPPVLATKALSKVDPRIGNFLTAALSAGYGTDLALNFLRDKFQSSGGKSEKQRLESGAARGTLRPDEMAAWEQIRQGEQIPEMLTKGAALGAGGLAGGLANRNKKQIETGEIPQSSSSARFGDPSIHGPEEQGPQQALMGPFRQGNETFPGPFPQNSPNISVQKPKIGSREEALKNYNERNKKKKLIEQLQQDFERSYGPMDSASSASNSDDQFLAEMEQILKM